MKHLISTLPTLSPTEVFFFSPLSEEAHTKPFSFLLFGQSPLDLRDGQRDDHKRDPARVNPVQRDQHEHPPHHEQGRVPPGPHGPEETGK